MDGLHAHPDRGLLVLGAALLIYTPNIRPLWVRAADTTLSKRPQ